MKAFPFAVWPGELIKAGPPEQSPYHRSRLLDPAQSYSVRRATEVVDPGRSYQSAKYIPAATLDSMKGYEHPGQKASRLSGATVGAHPTTSVYGRDRTEGFLPAGHAHRNADIKGRFHLQASADHDAAFHELSDLHRAIAATGSFSDDHRDDRVTMIAAARRRLEEAEMRVSHARSGHASALAEPMIGMPDTHHNENGSKRGSWAQDILLGTGPGKQNALSPDVVQFPAISFDMAADPRTGRAAKSAAEMAKEMASMGSTPFLAAYLAGGNSGFLPQENLEAGLHQVRFSQSLPKTPEEVSERYRFLEGRRRNHPFMGLGHSRGSDLASHVADGTSQWGDYSQNALHGRAFRPQAPDWARQGVVSTLGRTSTLRRLLDAFSARPSIDSMTRTQQDLSQQAPQPAPPQAGVMGGITRNYTDLPQQRAPKPTPPQAGVMGSITRTNKDLPPPR